MTALGDDATVPKINVTSDVTCMGGKGVNTLGHSIIVEADSEGIHGCVLHATLRRPPCPRTNAEADGRANERSPSLSDDDDYIKSICPPPAMAAGTASLYKTGPRLETYR